MAVETLAKNHVDLNDPHGCNKRRFVKEYFKIRYLKISFLISYVYNLNYST